MRSGGMGQYITCGTMFKNDQVVSAQQMPRRRNISKEKRIGPGSSMGTPSDLERQMLNNEYLKILKDPKFSDLNVNFLEF